MNTETSTILRLDDKTIEARTADYPPEAREATRWLAAFVREKCNKQISSLVARAKKLKFETDYSYWHKILTGKYFIPDAHTGKPAGSVQNFLQMVEELRKIERIEWRAGRPPFIETGTWELIRDALDKKRQPGRVNKFLGIVGPTGSQKTACFKEYRSRNNHGRVVVIDAPEIPRISQFYRDLAVAYGESPNVTAARMIACITGAVNETKCIIVDNVQRLYVAQRGGDQPIFAFLQKLQDDTDCTICLSYTPGFTKILTEGLASGYFEQFIGRMGGLRKALVLPEFAPRDDVLAIAQAYQFADAARHVKYLESISREPGRIRALFDDLQDAKALAESEKQALTIEHLRLVRGEEEHES